MRYPSLSMSHHVDCAHFFPSRKQVIKSKPPNFKGTPRAHLFLRRISRLSIIDDALPACCSDQRDERFLYSLPREKIRIVKETRPKRSGFNSPRFFRFPWKMSRGVVRFFSRDIFPHTTNKQLFTYYFRIFGYIRPRCKNTELNKKYNWKKFERYI